MVAQLFRVPAIRESGELTIEKHSWHFIAVGNNRETANDRSLTSKADSQERKNVGMTKIFHDDSLGEKLGNFSYVSDS